MPISLDIPIISFGILVSFDISFCILVSLDISFGILVSFDIDFAVIRWIPRQLGVAPRPQRVAAKLVIACREAWDRTEPTSCRSWPRRPYGIRHIRSETPAPPTPRMA